MRCFGEGEEADVAHVPGAEEVCDGVVGGASHSAVFRSDQLEELLVVEFTLWIGRVRRSGRFLGGGWAIDGLLPSWEGDASEGWNTRSAVEED